MTEPFWKTTSFKDMSTEQWESLCDGCAKCCLHKLEDENSGEVFYTNVVCKYLDKNCRCTCYQERNSLVPMCVWLTPETIVTFTWLPDTCAYRLIAEGSDLPDWHPLVSADNGSVHKAGISVIDKCISEEYVHPDSFEDHIIRWVKQ